MSKRIAVMLMWINDTFLHRLAMRRIGNWWLPKQPWHWMSIQIIRYHHRVLPDAWVLSGGSGGIPQFWMRRPRA